MDSDTDNPRPTMDGAILLSVPDEIPERARNRMMLFLGGILRRSVEVYTYESESSIEYRSPRTSFLSACRRLWESWRRIR